MFLKKLFRLVPSDPFTEGLDLFNQGRFEESLPVFQDLVDAEDSGVAGKARLYACEVHLNLGDRSAESEPREALEHYQKARAYQPTFADIHNKYGEICRRLGQPEAAVEAFRKSLEINPRYFLARLNLCQALVEMGRTADGAEEIQAMRGNCPPLYRELADELAAATEREDAVSQGRIFEEIRHLDPDRVTLLRDRALAEIRKGDPGSAAHRLEELIGDYPRFPDLRNMLGLAYGDMGRDHDAMAQFRAALDINPRYLKARINLGITLLELGQLEDAREELEHVLAVDHRHPLAISALHEIEAMSANT